MGLGAWPLTETPHFSSCDSSSLIRSVSRCSFSDASCDLSLISSEPMKAASRGEPHGQDELVLCGTSEGQLVVLHADDLRVVTRMHIGGRDGATAPPRVTTVVALPGGGAGDADGAEDGRCAGRVVVVGDSSGQLHVRRLANMRS